MVAQLKNTNFEEFSTSSELVINRSSVNQNPTNTKMEAMYGLIPCVTKVEVKTGLHEGLVGEYQRLYFEENPKPDPDCLILFPGQDIGCRIKISNLKILDFVEAEKPVGLFEQLKELPKLQPEEISKQLELPLEVSGKDLSRKEVLDLIKQINGSEVLVSEIVKFANNSVRYALMKIYKRRGYLQFGCKSFSAFLEENSDLFDKAYSSLQKEWQVGCLEVDVLDLKIGTLNEFQARAFYPLQKNIQKCREAYQAAVKIAEENNCKLSAKIIRAVVNGFLGVNEQPKIKTKCGWVQRPNAARYFRARLAGVEVNVHDTYTDAVKTLLEISDARNEAPEQIIIKGLLGIISQRDGLTNAGVIAAAVNFESNSK